MKRVVRDPLKAESAGLLFDLFEEHARVRRGQAGWKYRISVVQRSSRCGRDNVEVVGGGAGLVF